MRIDLSSPSEPHFAIQEILGIGALAYHCRADFLYGCFYKFNIPYLDKTVKN